MERFSGGVPGLSGRIHNLVDRYRVPCHTILLLYRVKNCSFSYYTLQLVSNNILMETQEVWARTGTCVPTWMPWVDMGDISCLCV